MKDFDWSLFAEAETFLLNQVSRFLDKSDQCQTLSNEIQKVTSTRIFDWVDHLVIPSSEVNESFLSKIGFSEWKRIENAVVLRVEGSVLFPLILKDGKEWELALKVEDIDNFREVYAKKRIIRGVPNAAFRKLEVNKADDFLFSVIERRGCNGYLGYAFEESKDVDSYVEALTAFGSRERKFGTPEEGLHQTEELIKNFVGRIGKQRTADAFFRSECRYWESRNHAAQIQKNRQDNVGVGWGNIDHYTFRSSRHNFKALIRLFELLGLDSRERFHAGEQAGWGAQVMEDSDARIVVFADVDLSGEEKEGDFAHQGLDSKQELGTVGLWVGLNGESTLEAGMHHLAARLRFDAAREDLKGLGIGMMKPFSNFPFLKQAFTEPGKWPVEKDKLTILRKNHQISEEQAAAFIKDGAVSSHLENIQRDQGFKGFNQNSVSAIIKLTNPLAQIEKNA